MLQQLFLIGIRYRAMVVTAIATLTLIFLAGLPDLHIDTGLDRLIPASDPDRLVYQRVMEEFGTDDKVIVYVKDPAIWTAQRLERFSRLHEALANLPDVERVDSLASAGTLRREGESLTFGQIMESPPPDDEAAARLRGQLLNHPLYTGEYLSADGQVLALVLTMKGNRVEQETSEQVYRRVEEVLEGYRSEFSTLFQTGAPRLYTELKTRLIDDFMLLGPVSIIAVFLIMLLFLRSLLAACLPLLTSALAMIWTLGMQAWLGIPVSILGTMLPSLITVIAAVSSIHLIVAYLRRVSQPRADNDHADIIAAVARSTGLVFLLTTLTTVLGFAGNIINDITLIRDFGLASTFALIVNGVITILILPPLLGFFHAKPKGSSGNRQSASRHPGRIVATIRRLQSTHPRLILTVTALICGYLFNHAASLYVTNDPITYFAPDQPLIRDNETVHEDLAGINTFFITLEANTEKTFLEPRNIEKLSEIQAFVDEQGVFDRSRSLADLLKYVHEQFQGSQPGEVLPRTRPLIAQYLLLFHRQDLDSYVSHDYKSANIIVRHNINDSRLLNQHVEELRSVVNQIAGAELVASIVGRNLMVNQAAETLLEAQVRALVTLLLLIFAIVSILFTSYKGGLIALLPAVIPIGLMFGIMGLLGIPLNPGTAMVAVIAIGLAVDGTIHLLTRYNELCRRSSDYDGAVSIAVQEVAAPLMIASLALCAGFAVLLFSGFTLVAQFGAMVTATLLFSIFANLVITPLIMTRIRVVGLYQILTMSLDEETLAGCTLFHGMTEYQRRKAILISELHEFRSGELLIEQDTVGRSMFLILTGEAEVVRRDEGGAHVLATLGVGQIFGEIGYIRETRRTADVRARSDLTALKFDFERMQKDLKYFPNIVAKLNFNISYILGQRLADMVEHSK